MYSGADLCSKVPRVPLMLSPLSSSMLKSLIWPGWSPIFHIESVGSETLLGSWEPSAASLGVFLLSDVDMVFGFEAGCDGVSTSGCGPVGEAHAADVILLVV
jgi:hypothetical protein